MKPRPVDLLNQDAQTLHVANSISAVTRCVERLAREGYTVLSVHVGDRMPRVVIERSARCARLHGAMAMRFCRGAGRKQIMVAERDGAQIQWCEEDG